MKRILHNVCAIITLVLASWSAQAGLLRYDMAYTSDVAGGPPDYSGYMLFSDSAPLGGNIWDSIVSWHFEVAGFVFNPDNTSAVSDGYFAVDAAGNFLRDYQFVSPIPELGILSPCFSNAATCDGGDIALGFQSFVTGTIVKFPGSGFDSVTIGGSIAYSGPTSVPMSIPIGGTLGLLSLGLCFPLVRRTCRLLRRTRSGFHKNK